MAGSPLHLLELAIDAGHEAQSMLGPATVSGKKPGFGLLALGVFGAQKFGQEAGRKKPPRENVRRASNALDSFAAELAKLSSVMSHADVDALARDAATWGTSFWDEETTARELQTPVGQAIDALTSIRAQVILGKA